MVVCLTSCTDSLTPCLLWWAVFRCRSSAHARNAGGGATRPCLRSSAAHRSWTDGLTQTRTINPDARRRLVVRPCSLPSAPKSPTPSRTFRTDSAPQLTGGADLAAMASPAAPEDRCHGRCRALAPCRAGAACVSPRARVGFLKSRRNPVTHTRRTRSWRRRR